MRILIFLSALVLPLLGTCQAPTPGKLRTEEGLFGPRYTLNDQAVTRDSVRLHLEKYNAQASVQWAFMRRAQRNTLFWGLVGGMGILGLSTIKQPMRAVWFSIPALAGCTGLVICTANEGRHRKRAVRLYNASSGY